MAAFGRTQLLDVPQLGGERLDAVQQPVAQGTAAGLGVEGVAQTVGGVHDLTFYVTGRCAGLAEIPTRLAHPLFAWVCGLHRQVVHPIVSEPHWVERRQCPICAEVALQRDGREAFDFWLDREASSEVRHV